MFLQVVVVLIAIGILACMLWLPQIEGRNAHATPFQIYFNDPFLAYAYAASIPGFIALAQGFRVLGHAGQDRAFSMESVKAVRTIKLCALVMIAFVAGAQIMILFAITDDDKAGGIMMGVAIALICIVTAAAAAMLERQLLQGVEMKMSAP